MFTIVWLSRSAVTSERVEVLMKFRYEYNWGDEGYVQGAVGEYEDDTGTMSVIA
jgi:hypothetical protein